MAIGYGVDAHARTSPAKPAVVDDHRVATFAELASRTNRLARAMSRRGLRAGDRVASVLRNSIEWFEVAGAAARIGVTVVPVSWRYQRGEVAYVVADSGSKLVFAEADARAVMTGLPATFLGSEYEAMIAAEEDSPLETVWEPLAGLRYYTSGTTGRPKAVVRDLPPGSARGEIRPIVVPEPIAAPTGPGGTRSLGRGQTEGLESPDEVHLMVGPAYHTAPGLFATRALYQFGQTVVLMHHFDAEACLRLIEARRVTYSHMVPINFVRILALPDAVRHAYDLSSVKRILHAAAPCPVDVKRAIIELFPEGAVYEYYGATEGLATVCPADEWLARPGTVGRAAPGISVAVLDDEGRERCCGEVGTVYFSTLYPVRYEGAPEKTDQARRDDLFTVGDMGYLDDDGYLFLTDRKIDLIISGGANVYPAEVEAVLYGHPAVADVTVFGVPDAEWGERVHAVIELRRPATEAEVIEFCRSRLAHDKCPTSVEFVTTLPRDPNGKIRKRLLRDPHWANTDRAI